MSAGRSEDAGIADILVSLVERAREPDFVFDLDMVPVPIALVRVTGDGQMWCQAANERFHGRLGASPGGLADVPLAALFEARAEPVVTYAVSRAVRSHRLVEVRLPGGGSLYARDVRSADREPELMGFGADRHVVIVAPPDPTEGASSDALFEALFAHSPAPWLIVSPDGRYLRANAAYCQVVGYSEAELQRLPPNSLRAVDDETPVGDEALRAFHAGKPSAYITVSLIRADGRQVDLRVMVTFVTGASYELKAILVQVVDSSERTRGGDARTGQTLTTLFPQLALTLAAASGPEIGEAVERALAGIGAATGAERVSVLSADQTGFRTVYSWGTDLWPVDLLALVPSDDLETARTRVRAGSVFGLLVDDHDCGPIDILLVPHARAHDHPGALALAARAQGVNTVDATPVFELSVTPALRALGGVIAAAQRRLRRG